MGKRLIYEVNRELEKWKHLTAQLLGEDLDPQTLLDTLEGETELYEALLVVADQALEYEYAARAVDDRIKDFTHRRNRLRQSAETLRAMILQVMEIANIQTIAGTDCTLSRKQIPPKPVIVDESQIPSRFWRPQPPALDRAALAAAIKANEKVLGAEIGNGGVTLSIRTT